MIRPAPVEIELGYRAYWLVQLRWVASSAIIYGSFIATSVVGLRLDPLPLYLIGAAIAMYNSLFIIALKWSEVGPQENRLRSARLITNGQIVADLLALTLLVHFMGGVENPIAFYFVFHVIIASILLSRRETFLQATLACILYGGLLAAELTGIVSHVHVLGTEARDVSHDPQVVVATLAVFVSTLYLAAYMATSIVARLRRRDEQARDLTAEVERKAGELQAAYQNLAELEEIKSRHLRKISQEIKPPLTSVQDSLGSLLSGTAGDLNPAQREMATRAERRTKEILVLVSDLLVLSRAREAKLFTERRPVDLVALARQVSSAQGQRAAEKGVELAVNLPSQAISVLGDQDAMEQLLSQLISNAVSYTLSGGRADVRIERLGEVVRLQVTDTGIGIPQADLPRVFNEFFRSENARRYKEEGTGLGLSIARSVVESHGGQIDVQSQLGAGTTVTVLLPAALEHVAEADEVTTPSARAVG